MPRKRKVSPKVAEARKKKREDAKREYEDRNDKLEYLALLTVKPPHLNSRISYVASRYSFLVIDWQKCRLVDREWSNDLAINYIVAIYIPWNFRGTIQTLPPAEKVIVACKKEVFFSLDNRGLKTKEQHVCDLIIDPEIFKNVTEFGMWRDCRVIDPPMLGILFPNLQTLHLPKFPKAERSLFILPPPESLQELTKVRKIYCYRDTVRKTQCGQYEDSRIKLIEKDQNEDFGHRRCNTEAEAETGAGNVDVILFQKLKSQEA